MHAHTHTYEKEVINVRGSCGRGWRGKGKEENYAITF